MTTLDLCLRIGKFARSGLVWVKSRLLAGECPMQRSVHSNFHRSVLVGAILVCAACAADNGEPGYSDPEASEPGPSYDELGSTYGKVAEAPVSDDSSPAETPTDDTDMPVVEGSDLSLIEEVHLPGRRVSFHEASDGSLVTINVGRIGNTSTSPKEEGLTGSRLYSFLTHKAAPKRLVDAELISGTTATQDSGTESWSGTEKAAAPWCTNVQGGCNHSPYTRDTWLASRCNNHGDLNINHLWYTGSDSITGISAKEVAFHVLSNQGTIRYEAKYNGSGLTGGYAYAYMLIHQGWYVDFEAQDGHAIPRYYGAYSKVSEAAGDIYDHCLWWW